MDNRLQAGTFQDGHVPARGGFGLWLPPSLIQYLSPGSRSGPVLRWVCRLSDRPGMPVSAADAWDRLQSVDPIAAIRSLAGINVGLEIDESGTQHAATERYVRPQFRPLSAPDDKHS